ncbi:MAG: carboxylating nicotinate-nucleotide diphosphorylase [Candidatus Omnitrophica bacterium]|nr:carboxylating nicotinate-nucleotide diphosphorylase [Candidatus Omnitrophota bacterium]MCM8793077.1 carboxylating nicotinate-nucleotide diphosphorylase [Candidatus Omnitrophota bacterium]
MVTDFDFKIVDSIIAQALKEDKIDQDITSELLFPKDKLAKAIIVAKGKGIIAGLEIAERVFYLLDKKIKFKKLTKDGKWIKKGEKVAFIEGSLKKILAGERTALNFLMRLSGIATLTRKFVEKVHPHKVKIMDTRKTTPGLRILEKYAVRVGGGVNHRGDLSDGVLIKDNHLKKIKNQKSKIKSLIQEIRRRISQDIEIEIEVKNLKEFKEALETGCDVIMLDNMSFPKVKEAVRMRSRLWAIGHRPGVEIEVSGGINLRNIRKFASLGIERISIGALTHSYKSLDFSLELTP